MSAEPIELTLALHTSPSPEKKMVLVSELGDARKGAWLPRKQIEIEDLGKLVPGTDVHGNAGSFPMVKVTLPEWLAIDRGLV